MTEANRWRRAYRSHAEFYAETYGQHVTTMASIGSTGATLIEAHQLAGDWSDAPNPDLTIAWLASAKVGYAVDLGAGRFAGGMNLNDAIVIAPGAGSRVEMHAQHVCRMVSVPYAKLVQLTDSGRGALPEDGDFGCLHTRLLNDAALTRLRADIWREGQAASLRGSLWMDGALLQLAALLLTLRDGTRSEARGGLAPAVRRRVIEYLEARLADDVGLAELAAIAGLSPNHFCTAFRQSMGEPPHRYFMRRRIERAREMLADPRLPITEVALACGFASSAHFATAFRKAVGASPSAYRREQAR